MGQKTLLAKSQNTNGFLNYPRGRQLVREWEGAQERQEGLREKVLNIFVCFAALTFSRGTLHVASCTLHVSLCFARCIELSAAIRLQLV